jgi:drug/metabolite transporter (DMT)-like permease
MVAILGFLTVVAVLPLGLMGRKEQGSWWLFVPILCGFGAGTIYLTAEDNGSAPIVAVIAASGIAGISIYTYFRWRSERG